MRIDAPYLLALFTVEVYEHEGVQYLDQLWAQDLRRHAAYIPDLTLVCYSAPGIPAQAVKISDCPLLSRVRLVLVPKPRNTAHAVRTLPATMRTLWRATRGKEVVHSGVAGWPIPSSWLLLPMQLVRGFLSVIVVESAFWRSLEKNTLARRAWRAFNERMNAVCLRLAHLPIFTSEGYRRSLLGSRAAMVRPAAWIQADGILSDLEAELATRSRDGLRLVFAGRLDHNKGLPWLVQALDRQQIPGTIELDVFGAGPMQEWVRGAQVDSPDLRIRYMGTLPYGPQFFAALRGYDALVLPTLTDEQPRILFDAYSQGLPVIGSRTDGVVDYLRDGEHGTSFAVHDEVELASAITRFASLRQHWPQLAQNCLTMARRCTHESMHRERALAINAALAARGIESEVNPQPTR